MKESGDRPTGFLLVGMSSAFADAALLSNKLSVYLRNLGDVDIIALNDAKGIVAHAARKPLIDSLSPEMPLREKRQLVQSAGWVIMFWDGSDLSDFLHLSLLYKKPLKIVTVTTTRVVNKDRGDAFDIYIGRGTPWGNPFAIGEDGMDRAAVIAAYREYFKKKFIDDEQGRRSIMSLRGKVLGCHCKPSQCHGDVISEYLNSLSD